MGQRPGVGLVQRGRRRAALLINNEFFCKEEITNGQDQQASAGTGKAGQDP